MREMKPAPGALLAVAALALLVLAFGFPVVALGDAADVVPALAPVGWRSDWLPLDMALSVPAGSLVRPRTPSVSRPSSAPPSRISCLITTTT